MELESSYQLLGVLRDDGIRTYSAIEIASGQALQVHLFASTNSEVDRALFKALRALPVNRRRELLEIGTEGDKPYIVTESLPDTTTAREWLTKLAGTAPAKPGGPVVVAGSWKTGTPIPEDLIRASHSSLPPKPPPPPPKPAELSPDYTRVMRLPQMLSANPPAVEAERIPEPVLPLARSGAQPPPLPLEVPPPIPPEVPSEALPEQPEVVWAVPVPEPAVSAQSEGDGLLERDGMVGPTPPPSQLEEFDRMFLGAQPPEPAPREPGEFTRMFLAAQASQLAGPAVPPVPVPPQPAALAVPPAPVPPQPAAPAVPPAPVPPQPPTPAIPPAPVPPQPPAHEPGEFTRMFLASQPPEPAPPVVPAQALGQQATPAVPQQPGEFTSQFRSAVPPPPAPPQPTPVDEEATRIFQPMPAAPPPPPSLQAQQAFSTQALPQPAFSTQGFPQQASPQQAMPVHPVPVQPSSEETTRLFQAVSPSTPPAPVKEPGEFTRMFPAMRPDSPAAPGPSLPIQAPPIQASPMQPPSTQQAGDGPSEFTRFFQSPMYPAAGNQRVPSSPQQATPLAPVTNRPSAQASEFTQMFGNPSRPDPGGLAPPSPMLGSGGGMGSGGIGSGSATGAFSIPRAPSVPPPNSSGPGEFTRMMSASAAPTLGQPSTKPSAPAPIQSETKSKMPLYIIGGAVLLAIILIILFFVLRPTK